VPPSLSLRGRAIRYKSSFATLIAGFPLLSLTRSCIIASTFAVDKHDISELKDEVLQNNIFYTCPDFITFIYYTWVENLAWFSEEEGDGEDFQAEAVKEFIKNYKENLNKS